MLITFFSWQFKTLGLAVVPIVVATPFIWFFGGYLADKISNAVARRNGGRREPETHLFSLILPLLLGIVGCVMFGYAAQNIKKTHWGLFLGSVFLISVSFLTVSTVLNVYVVESYPQWAG
jgi:MFS family permease